MNAREQARVAAKAMLTHNYEWWLPNLVESTANAASDVWEEQMKLIRTIIDDCAPFSAEECIKAVRQVVEEVLGE